MNKTKEDVIEYIKTNNVVNYEYISSINIYEDSIQIIYYNDYKHGSYWSISKSINMIDFEKFLLQRRVDKINKLLKELKNERKNIRTIR